MMRQYFSFIGLALVALLLAGCYHFGSPGQTRKFAMAKLELENLTTEAMVGRQLAGALRERFATDPATTLHSQHGQPFLVTATITKLDNLAIARAEIRDNLSRDDDSKAYQTVLFRVALYAELTFTRQGDEKPTLKRSYVGYGDLPQMHDREIPLRHACQQAANSIASQAVADLAACHE